jgi:uncharacterized membrane protein YphA (DoxX/SURF4 family)
MGEQVLHMAGMFGALITYTPYLALLLRLVMGANLVLHGYPKPKSPQQTLQWTKSLGVPAPATYATIVLEFFGGIALIMASAIGTKSSVNTVT